MGLGHCCCCSCQYTNAAVPTTTTIAGSACGLVIRVVTDTACGTRVLVVLVLLLPACAVLHEDEGTPAMSMSVALLLLLLLLENLSPSPPLPCCSNYSTPIVPTGIPLLFLLLPLPPLFHRYYCRRQSCSQWGEGLVGPTPASASTGAPPHSCPGPGPGPSPSGRCSLCLGMWVVTIGVASSVINNARY